MFKKVLINLEMNLMVMTKFLLKHVALLDSIIVALKRTDL